MSLQVLAELQPLVVEQVFPPEQVEAVLKLSHCLEVEAVPWFHYHLEAVEEPEAMCHWLAVAPFV
jgi:hypothetical protein